MPLADSNQTSVVPGTALGNRSLAAWEIVSVVASALIAEWMLVPAAGLSKGLLAIPIGLAFLLIICSHRARQESLNDLGFRLDNFVSALVWLLPPMLVISLLLLLVGYFSRTGIDFRRWGGLLAPRLPLSIAWALVQQYALQAFINRRSVIILGTGWRSIALVAVIFAGLHLPNLWLTAITLAGGAIWAAIYQRVPNLFALAISHAIMTWIVVSTVPPEKLYHLRLGFKYFG